MFLGVSLTHRTYLYFDLFLVFYDADNEGLVIKSHKDIGAVNIISLPFGDTASFDNGGI